MNLYTFVANFKGGTYISQVKASSEKKALVVWAKKLDGQKIPRFSEVVREEMIEDLQQEGAATPILGVKNVWCASVATRNLHGLVNFVQTSSVNHKQK